MKDKIAYPLVISGMLLIAAGIILPFFIGINNYTFKIIYAAGALLLLVGRLLAPDHSKNLRLRRLHRLESWSALIFCVGAFFLFYNQPGTPALRDTIAFTLAGAAIQIYTSIMIPRIKDK